MTEWVTVLRAADIAARWHVQQRRKGEAQEPYINHLLEVASLVAEATHGQDPEVVTAALLHDAMEDQAIPVELIEREFGTRVADMVQQLTDDKNLPKDMRRAAQVQNASSKVSGAKLIKLADKTSNLRAIANSRPSNWSIVQRLEYIGWARDVVAGLRGTSPSLERKFDEAADEAKNSVGIRSGSQH